MIGDRLGRYRFGTVAVAGLCVAAVQTLLLAWVWQGLKEDREQRAAVKTLEHLGGSVTYDFEQNKFLRPEIQERWRSDVWLLCTPPWKARWWISTFTNVDPPLGTVATVRVQSQSPMTVAQWDYFCRAFSFAYGLELHCPLVDKHFSCLRGMTALESVKIVSSHDEWSDTLGDGLAELKSLRRLTRLELVGVGLSDVAKNAIGSLSGLSSLTLVDTADDATLAQVTRLKNLSTLLLSGGTVTDAGLFHLRKLPALRRLQLENLTITDDGLHYLEGLKIEELALAGTQVSDRGLNHLMRLPDLTRLDLSGTNLTDAAVPDLAKLKNLRALCLIGTKVTPGGCRELREAMPKLKTLIPPGFSGAAFF
jgi:hypothetical protein